MFELEKLLACTYIYTHLCLYVHIRIYVHVCMYIYTPSLNICQLCLLMSKLDGYISDMIFVLQEISIFTFPLTAAH